VVEEEENMRDVEKACERNLKRGRGYSKVEVKWRIRGTEEEIKGT
jgi:hypothetical protein